jgi:CHAD domain-containing protein
MSTAAQSFSSNLHTVLSLLPSLRDGDVDAIHDARVATRRLRAALPIVAIDRPSDAWDEATKTLRTAGRSLGKARDVDVALDVLEDLERRAPMTAPAAAAMRARLLPEQLERRRKLIKRLEALDLGAVALAHGPPRRERGLLTWRQPPSRRVVQFAIGEGARELRTVIEHASGVYFPARAHRVRIAMKKLRYLVELQDTDQPGRRRSLKVLRQAQEILGEMHDREVLMERLKRLRRKEDIPGARVLLQVLDAEARALFRKYVTQRQDLLAVTETLQRSTADGARPTRVATRVLQVSAVALPSAAVLLLAGKARAS